MTENLAIDLNDKDTWDDSLLIKGWEEGLKEYKVSIAICLLLGPAPDLVALLRREEQRIGSS